MKIKELEIGADFTMVLKNKHGQSVHTTGNYKKVSDNRVRDNGDGREWNLADCGLTPETEITGTVWGAPK